MKNGKRTRRALIRFRHAMAREKFARWVFRLTHLPIADAVVHWRTPEWHQWHALGCP